MMKQQYSRKSFEDAVPSAAQHLAEFCPCPLTIFGVNLLTGYFAENGVFADAGSTPARQTSFYPFPFLFDECFLGFLIFFALAAAVRLPAAFFDFL